MKAPVHIVWFKRDLRTLDHAALHHASRHGPVLPLYVIEEEVVHAPDFSERHWAFIRDSLKGLRAALAALGQPLVVRVGRMPDVLAEFEKHPGIAHVWAHEETGNDITFKRDIRVARWLKQRGIPFTELRQHGVIRGLRNRDRWANAWESHMTAPVVPVPEALHPLPQIAPGSIPKTVTRDTSISHYEKEAGEIAGHNRLHLFLNNRARNYMSSISSPESSRRHCSRLSAHLAWGTLSMRTVLQETRRKKAHLKAQSTSQPAQGWLRSLSAFESRLHWHCHFIQKLETEPDIEFQSFIPAFDDLRHDFSEAHFQAWKAGMTGYPLVDACMRALRATGYLNFRMRAMLVSFAAYDLWLDWRTFHAFLARQWTDYEPGIHLCQLQMQSGTTGINALRIYNPVKQSLDHDPEGRFIRKWVPELSEVPLVYLHQPWKMPPQKAGPHSSYPAPIVAHEQAARLAKTRIAALRKDPLVIQQAEAVYQKHGSRRAHSRSNRPGKKESQLVLHFPD